MSLTIDSQPKPTALASVARPGSQIRLWVQVGLAVVLVSVSAGVRVWQQARVESTVLSGWVSPFPLEDLPLELGPWEGHTGELDPLIARSAGAVDTIHRSYVDRRTGCRINMIVLYGPASSVYIHAPELCYPTAGYTQVGPKREHKVPLPDGRQIPFRSLVYAKGEGGPTSREEVYYTWHYNNRWTPYMLSTKRIQRLSGMYKVHLARPVTETEKLGDSDPCQEFLSFLLPELERRINESESHAPPPG